MSEEILKLPKEGLVYEFGPFALDGARRLLWLRGELVELEPLVIKTLFVLVRAKGDLVEKSELVMDVWDGSAVSDDSLTRNIYRLRRSLSGALEGRDCIRTIAKRGYCFTLPVTERRDGQNGLEVQGEGKSVEPAQRPTPRKPWQLLLASALGIAVLAAALGAVILSSPRPLLDEGGEWTGILAFPEQEMRVVVHIRGADPAWQVSLDSPDQGVTGLAVSTISHAGNSITFNLDYASFVFRGTLEGDRIRGTFSQYGVDGTLALTRQATTPPGHGLAGDWNGALQFPPRQFGCALHMKRRNGTQQASIDFPDQGAFGLLVTMVLQQGRDFEFAIAQWGTHFHGQIEEGGTRISGTITQPGMTGKLVLTRLPDVDVTLVDGNGRKGSLTSQKARTR